MAVHGEAIHSTGRAAWTKRSSHDKLWLSPRIGTLIASFISHDPVRIQDLLPFRSLDIFTISTMTQFTQLYRWVPDYRRWWKCECLVVACNCCMTRMLPREVELEWTGLPVEEKCKTLWAAQRLETVLHKNIPSPLHQQSYRCLSVCRRRVSSDSDSLNDADRTDDSEARKMSTTE